MLLKAATDGSQTGTGTANLASYILGGVLITADGTNNATIIVRRNDANGKQVFKLVTKVPLFITGPISLEGTQAAYYDISGTGAAAQLFEWVE